MIDALAPQPGRASCSSSPRAWPRPGCSPPNSSRPAGKVLITDQAAAMVAGARERAQELGVENVEFKEMGGEWIDLPTASVDGVLCRWGYMLMVDPPTALRETRRVLRPGGRVVLAVWDSLAGEPVVGVPPRRCSSREGLAAPPAAHGMATRPVRARRSRSARRAARATPASSTSRSTPSSSSAGTPTSRSSGRRQLDLSRGLARRGDVAAARARGRQMRDAVRDALAPLHRRRRLARDTRRARSSRAPTA